MTYTLAFVDQISGSASTRLDLTAAPWSTLAGTDFGLPELRRAVVGSLLVDGEHYPAASYGNRVLSLILRVEGTEDEAAAQFQLLYRELDRAGNILRYQPGTTDPVYFRTHRCGPDAVTWDPFTREVRVKIPADPFALGLRETLSPVAVSNDPAGGLVLDVDSPRGDVETPLYLSVDASDVARVPESGGTGRVQTAIAVRRRGTPSAVSIVLQAESMSPTTDTSAVAVAGASGGSVLRTTFTTLATMQERAAGTFPSGADSVDARGTYRVFLRCKQNTSADVMQIQARFVVGGVYVTSDAVAGPAGGVWRWVDLGLVQLPGGYDPVTDGLSGSPLAVDAMSVYIHAARTSGSGSLDLDALAFMPADDRLCLIKWPEVTTDDAYVVDSTAGEVYAVGASGEVSGSLVELIGGPPMVTPGADARLWIIRDVGQTTNGGDLITSTTDITPYYWPKYLYVRGVTS